MPSAGESSGPICSEPTPGSPMHASSPSGRTFEFLEDRITPSGNIAITNAFVVDGNDQPLTAINIGEFVSIQADFTTQDLPADASYVVGYTVNGLTQDTGTITGGAGVAGTESFVLLLGRLRCHTRHEPGHGHRRSGPVRARDNVTPTTP